VSEGAPDPLSFTEPVLCTTPLFLMNEVALKTKACKIFSKTDYFFGGGILNLLKRSTLPKGFTVKDIGLIAYRRGVITPRHLDGAMSSACNTLLVGKKTWNIFGPDPASKKYVAHQEAGQTLYVPAGFSHEVISAPPESIAYVGIWDTPTPKALSLFVGNRKFLRSSSKIHQEGVIEDMTHIHEVFKKRKTGKRTNETDIDFLIRIATVQTCKSGGVSTTRRKMDGRMRTRGGRRNHLTLKKRKPKQKK
jgi:hypothetical protein